MNTYRATVLALAGLGFLGFGIWFLIDPISPLAMIGIGVSGAPAATELRAFYGGVQVAIAALMLYAVAKPQWRTPALWLVLAVNGGIARRARVREACATLALSARTLPRCCRTPCRPANACVKCATRSAATSPAAPASWKATATS